MQNFDQLAKELDLTPDQKTAIEQYCSQIVVELLESIKQDFDETIGLISASAASGN